MCGDGVRQHGEQCEDGNLVDGDGCSSLCQIESFVCGNGKVDRGEQCDDGNTIPGDGCSANCTFEGASMRITRMMAPHVTNGPGQCPDVEMV